MYVVVFDLSQSGYRDWWFPAFGLIFVAMGIGLVLWRRRHPATSRARKWFPYFYLGFSLFWTLISFIATFGEYYHLSRALASGRVQFLEGRVERFEPMPYEGHSEESFFVNGKCFSYSDYQATSAFNNTRSHGGPINEGLQVRIWYVGNHIVKLAIWRANKSLQRTAPAPLQAHAACNLFEIAFVGESEISYHSLC